MLKKIAPLIILVLFIIGSYFIIQGLNKATDMTRPQTTSQKKESKQ